MIRAAKSTGTPDVTSPLDLEEPDDLPGFNTLDSF